MKAINYFSRVVPCKKNIEITNTAPYLGKELFSTVTNSLMRVSPDSSLVISGKTINNVLYLDNEIANIIKQPTFNLHNIPKYIVDNLIKKQIIKRTNNPNNLKLFFCEDDKLPYFGRIEITDVCQCHCDICYKDDNQIFEPSLSALKNRILHLKKLGIVRLELLGGEPFLRKDFAELCNFINKEGFLYTIITNGEYLSSLDKKTVNAIKKANEIIISVDAFGKMHDGSRKRPGLFHKIIDGIKFLKNLDIKCSLLCTINENTASSLDNLINYLKPLEIDLFVRPTILSGNAKNNNLSNVNMKKIYDKYKNTPHVFHNTVNLVDKISEAKYYGCDIRHLINIDVKGNLLPCHMNRCVKTNPIETYTPNKLLNELNDLLVSRLNNQKSCKECNINNSSNGIVCGGFCQFSNTFINNKIK